MGLPFAQAVQPPATWLEIGVDRDVERSGAAAVTLPDGRTLIFGGVTVDGTVTASVLLYDATTGTATAAGSMLAAREDHSATLLADGRVVIVGGTVDGAASADIEIFTPATQSSALVAQLAQPRADHAAALLHDGRVLIAGGAGVDSGPLASAELLDVATNSTGLTQMVLARRGASATTLIDGRVLVAGGNDGTNDLRSAELFDPSSETFAFTATQLSVARQGHAAVLLPQNNSVVIAGGRSNGVPQRAADLFIPAEFPDPFSYGEGRFASTGSLVSPRSRAFAGGTSAEGHVFVAGGSASNGEVYRFATLKTDKDDYAPGELAIISGDGWVPGETVTLLFQEDPAVHDDYRLNVVADGEGRIYWNQWAPDAHDFGVRFFLTAIGSQSRAQVTFTDGGTLTVIVTGTGNGSVSASGAGVDILNCTKATSPCADGTNSNGNTVVTATAAAGSVFAGWSGACTGTGTCQVSMNGTNVTPSLTATFNSVGTAPAITSANSATFTVGEAGSFSVTSSGDPAATLSIAGSLPSGVTFTPGAGGTATIAGTPALGTVGSYGITIQATNGVTPNATQTFTLVVQKTQQAALVLSVPASVTYGTTGIATVSGGSGTGAVTFSAGASTGCSIDPGSGVIAVTNASGSCFISASKAGDANFNGPVTDGPAGVTLVKATPTATLAVSNSPQTYNGSPQAATVAISASSVPGTAANVLTGGAATKTNAGTYAVTADFVPNDTDNYNSLIALAAGNFVIEKAIPVLTWLPNPLAPLTVGAPLGGALNATANVAGLFSYSAGATPLTTTTVLAIGAHALTATFTPADLVNYVSGVTVSNSIAVNYGVCLLYDPLKTHKRGSTVPLKIFLCDTAGNNLSAVAVVVTATQVVKLDSTASSLTVEDSGQANPDSNFRFDPTLGTGGGYIFNLSTKAGYSTGTWKLALTVNGAAATAYAVTFDVR